MAFCHTKWVTMHSHPRALAQLCSHKHKETSPVPRLHQKHRQSHQQAAVDPGLELQNDAQSYMDGSFEGLPSTSGRLCEEDVQQMLQVGRVSPRKLHNLFIKNVEVLPELLELIKQKGQAFDFVNTTHALNKLAKLYRLHVQHRGARPAELQGQYVGPTLALLNRLIVQHMRDFEPWDVAECFWAYGVLGYSEPAILTALLHKAHQFAGCFRPADCANIFWGFATLGLCELEDELLWQLADMAKAQIREFKPCELANVAWAVGKLEMRHGKTLLVAIANEVVLRLDSLGLEGRRAELFKTQELANILWACARLKCKHPRLLSLMEDYLPERLPEMNPQDMANILWAFAKLRHKPLDLLEQLPNCALGILDRFRPEEIALLMYSYGVLEHKHKLLLEEAAQEMSAGLAQLPDKELVMLLWSYGHLQYRPVSVPQFVDHLVLEVHQRCPRLLPTALAVTVKSMVHLSCRPPDVLHDFASQAQQEIAQFQPPELAKLLWGLSMLQHSAPGLLQCSAQRVTGMMQCQAAFRLTPVHVSSIVQSFERLGLHAEAQALLLAAETNNIPALSTEQYIAFQEMQAEQGGEGTSAQGLKPSKSRRALKPFTSNRKQPAGRSDERAAYSARLREAEIMYYRAATASNGSSAGRARVQGVQGPAAHSSGRAGSEAMPVGGQAHSNGHAGSEAMPAVPQAHRNGYAESEGMLAGPQTTGTQTAESPTAGLRTAWMEAGGMQSVGPLAGTFRVQQQPQHPADTLHVLSVQHAAAALQPELLNISRGEGLARTRGGSSRDVSHPSLFASSANLNGHQQRAGHAASSSMPPSGDLPHATHAGTSRPSAAPTTAPVNGSSHGATQHPTFLSASNGSHHPAVTNGAARSAPVAWPVGAALPAAHAPHGGDHQHIEAADGQHTAHVNGHASTHGPAVQSSHLPGHVRTHNGAPHTAQPSPGHATVMRPRLPPNVVHHADPERPGQQPTVSDSVSWAASGIHAEPNGHSLIRPAPRRALATAVADDGALPSNGASHAAAVEQGMHGVLGGIVSWPQLQQNGDDPHSSHEAMQLRVRTAVAALQPLQGEAASLLCSAGHSSVGSNGSASVWTAAGVATLQPLQGEAAGVLCSAGHSSAGSNGSARLSRPNPTQCNNISPGLRTAAVPLAKE